MKLATVLVALLLALLYYYPPESVVRQFGSKSESVNVHGVPSFLSNKQHDDCRVDYELSVQEDYTLFTATVREVNFVDTEYICSKDIPDWVRSELGEQDKLYLLSERQ